MRLNLREVVNDYRWLARKQIRLVSKCSLASIARKLWRSVSYTCKKGTQKRFSLLISYFFYLSSQFHIRVNKLVQVYLCQNLSFLNHLIHNMTTDCSLIFDFSTRKIHVQNMLCTKIDFLFLFWHSKQFIYTTCSELVVFMYRTGKSMNNLLSYCGLVDARISASEKDLPVRDWCFFKGYSSVICKILKQQIS